MCNKMDIGKLPWTARQICFRIRLLARKYPLLSRRKMPGNTLHLGGGFWEFGIFIVRCDAVADEKQPAVAFLLAFTDVRAYRAEQPQRAGIRNRYVFNPEVQLRFGQGLIREYRS